jgi:hypothetical protein
MPCTPLKLFSVEDIVKRLACFSPDLGPTKNRWPFEKSGKFYFLRTLPFHIPSPRDIFLIDARKMQKMQRKWKEISAELVECLRNSQATTPHLARLTGANYHAIRRYRQFGVKSRTQNALKLCRHFSIEFAKNAKTEIGVVDIMHAIEHVWDGTPAHAELLVSLIESTKPFKLKKK